jgi:PadR family transcriptional regulator, regulatory protein PadR
MGNEPEIWQGALALMVRKTLEQTGPLHGYGLARRSEQTSAQLLSVNYGSLYPALFKLEQEGDIASERGLSDHHRKAKFYHLTCAGQKRLAKETQDWLL